MHWHSEIEYHIRTNIAAAAGQGSAVVDVVVPRGNSNPQLVAFLAIENTISRASTATKEFQEAVQSLKEGLHRKLQAQLPMHMIPSFYIGVKSIPLTGTGKTDRRQLRKLGESMTLEQLAALNVAKPGQRHVPLSAHTSYTNNIDQQRAVEFWTEQFEELEAVPYPLLTSKTPEYSPLADGLLSKDINKVAWVEGLTASSSIRLALSILMTWQTNSSDVIFGAITNRPQPSVPNDEFAVFDVPNTTIFPVRSVVDATKTVLDLLRQVESQADEMAAHEQISLQLIRRVSKRAEVACQFQTILLVQAADEDPEPENVNFAQSEHTRARVNAVNLDGFNTYGLIIECLQHRSGLHLRMNFDTHLIKHEQASTLVRQFEYILKQICKPENGAKRLSAINKLCNEDSDQIWNWNSCVPENSHECVHKLIEKTAQQQPHACALYAWDGMLTYGELDDLSSRLAHYLVNNFKLGPEIVVPLCFEKTVWMPVAMLGVMKAGGASVAIDMMQPEEPLRAMVSQLKPVVLLASSKHRSRAHQLAEQHVVVVDKAHLLTLPTLSKGQMLPSVRPSDMLYVVFTSGSTGTPKGVVITHSALSSAIYHQRKALNIGAHSRVFDTVSYAFDLTWANTCYCLEVGGCLCIPSDDGCSIDLTESIETLNVTHLFITPSAAITIPLETIARLEMLILGGEILPADYVEAWANLTQVKNAYGPSECTPIATFSDVLQVGGSFTGSIGKGYGLNTWIVDVTAPECLAPIGKTGELYLEGPLLGRGYLGDMVKTAEAFIEDPPWLLKGGHGHAGRHGRVYKTGDIVRYSSVDGSVTFVGRKDAQVNIGGQRVGLGDVEFHLRNNLSNNINMLLVAEAAKPKESSNIILVAFLQPQGQATYDHMDNSAPYYYTELDDMARADLNSLNERLGAKLPLHMIPRAYILMKSIPKTASGKVDRRKLRHLVESMTMEQLVASNHARAPLRVPSTSIEIRLQRLWSSILGIREDSIGADDSFLRVGGDSVRIMMLLRKIIKEFGLRISFQRLMERNKLGELAMEIAHRQAGRKDVISLEKQFQDIRSIRSTPVESDHHVQFSSGNVRKVFLTGATGYLGTSILRNLVLDCNISYVAVLVRARSLQDAERRVIDAAKHTGWWLDEYGGRISFWLGDLEQVNLGLSESRWASLAGTCDPAECFDVIVHCGAKVDWYSNYDDLRATNVMSALHLHQALSTNSNLKSYVYISTNPEPDWERSENSESRIREELAKNTGYGQTKLVAEHALLQTLIQPSRPDPRVFVIKPGFIIGSTGSGIANSDDFIWRVVAGAISLGFYPEEPRKSWVYLSTYESLTATILGFVFNRFSTSHRRHSICCGLPSAKFWAGVNNELRHPLKPRPFDLWKDMIEEYVGDLGEHHPIYPVLGFIERGRPPLGSCRSHAETKAYEGEDALLQAAVSSNVRHLLNMGYFSGRTGKQLVRSVFRRGVT